MTPDDWDVLAELAGEGAPQPRLLDGTHRAYLIEGGPADVFVQHGRSRHHFVARLPEHSAVPSAAVPGEWHLKIVPLQGTRLLALDRTRFALLEHVARVGSDEERDQRWLAAVTAFRRALGRSLRVMVSCDSNAIVSLLRTGELTPAADLWISQVVHAAADAAMRADEKLLGSVCERKLADQAAVAEAARRALGVLGGHTPAALVSARPDVREVLRVVAERAGVPVADPGRVRQEDSHAQLRSVARRAGVRLREVRLGPDWWHHDQGPLVGWRRPADAASTARDAVEPGADTSAEPIATALLFLGGRYYAVDPATRARTPVGAALAATFEPEAAAPQPALPPRAARRHLLGRALSGTGRELRVMLSSCLAVAALHLATPLLVGHVLGRLLQGDLSGLSWDGALYLTSAVVAALFEVVLNLRTLRFEDRAESGAQLALWDRVLRLHVSFFAATSSGVLANKITGIAHARQALAGVITRAGLAFLTAVAGTVLLAGSGLTAVASWFVAGTAVVSAVFGALVAIRQRNALPALHRAAAVATEMFQGIVKIKIAAAESRAFSRWTDVESRAQTGAQRVRKAQAMMSALAVTLPVAGQFVLFAALAGPMRDHVSAESFFTVYAGFTLVITSTVALLSSGVELVAVLPRLDAVADVLAEAPESAPGATTPARLSGAVEVRDLSFGYPGADAPALDSVSLAVRAGEFVAVVGPSGSGKSTLLRLLLGFERPTAGTVRYDDADLSGLDVREVRRQCGVVLQDGKLYEGTIRQNICGANELPLDEVWEAARMAGVDEDVERMPMGLNSLVPFGGGTLSAGQRQRLLIARALVGKPRVLLFDEATSALDNRTQEIVTAATRRLGVTRIVIAHRLSTVRNADRIVVMDKGRIVQIGTFSELYAVTAGLFHALARRQVTEPPEPHNWTLSGQLPSA